MLNPNEHYNELPGLPPIQEVETNAVLKSVIEARSALNELNLICNILPNKSVLLNTILILEAKGSSEVEAIITTTDELFKFDTQRSNEYDTETKEAYRYCMALKQGLQVLESGRPFNFNLAKSVASTLLGTDVALRNHSVSLTNPANNTCYYTPPLGESVLLEKLKNWENFINEPSNLDPLVRLAVAHYQFEAIHPFSDGNGRTGRILNLLFLVKEGILSYPILYLSRYILQNRSQYYTCLKNVTFEQQWEPMILFMLKALTITARWTTEKVKNIQSLIGTTKELIQQNIDRIDVEKTIEVLFTQPYCRIKNFVDAGIAHRQTASKYIDKLIASGILQESNLSKKTDKLYVNKKFLNVLNRE